MTTECESAADTFTTPWMGWPKEPRHFNFQAGKEHWGRDRVDRVRQPDRAGRRAGEVFVELWRAINKTLTDVDAFVSQSAVYEPSQAPRGALAALDRIAKLPKNWDTYGSPPVPDASVHQARALLILVQMARCSDPTVSPVSGGGGIQFEWNRGEHGVEVYIDADGEVSYLRTDSDEVIQVGASPTRAWLEIQKMVKWVEAT